MHVHLQEIPIVEVQRVDEELEMLVTCRDDAELQPAEELEIGRSRPVPSTYMFLKMYSVSENV
jgi:hypothetical protein